MRGVYCWPQSAVPGESVAVFFGPNPSRVSITITREGRESIEVLTTNDVDSPGQSLPADVSKEGLDWASCFEFEVSQDWASGFYLVSVTDDEGRVSEAFFVVRSNEVLDAILVLSTSTWAAYNHWGGPSFYMGSSHSSLRRPLPKGFLRKEDPMSHRIAQYMYWDEPMQEKIQAQKYSAWCMAAGWANQEILFVRWAEEQGLNLAYAISEDLDKNPRLLDGYPLYISVGHDEYWSTAMRDNVEDFVSSGGKAAFFSGNTAFWQARFEDDRQTLVSYKTNLEADPFYDPSHAPELTSMWSDPLVGRPESEMTGVSFTYGGYAHMPNAPKGTGGYQIWEPDHWVFDSVEATIGSDLGAEDVTVAYECDGCPIEIIDGVPKPIKSRVPEGFRVLATAPAHLWETQEAPTMPDGYIGELNWVATRLGGEDTESIRAKYADGHAVMGVFPRGKGEVFTTGCTDWAYGLKQQDVSTVTRNVIDRFLDR